MGLLKSITRPISKFLDKVIPNEIKPALPYMAAFAPFMMGPQSGIMGSSMLRRALTSGAFNLGSQLSQEGSEGEFNPLSVLLAGSTGAMTSADAPGFFEGMQKPVPYKDMMTDTVISPDSGIMSSISDAVGKGGQTAAKFLIEQGKVLRPDETPLTMTNALTAGALPVTQATADLAMADARLALRDYEDQMAADESTSLIDDDGRRRAIRAAMEASNHLESTILDTLAALGLKQGGIVGLKKGGRVKYDRGGDYYGNFGRDRYLSEMTEDYGGILTKAEELFSDYEKDPLIQRGEFPDPEDMKVMRKRYAILEDQMEDLEGQYQKNFPDETGVDPYYIKKVDKLDKQEAALNKEEDRLNKIYEKLDVSGITRSPGFQNWLELYEAGDPKAKEHPYHEEFEDILFQSGYVRRKYKRMENLKAKGGRIGYGKGGSIAKLIDGGMDPSTALSMWDDWKDSGSQLSFEDYVGYGTTENYAHGGVASVLPKGREADYRGGGVIPVGSRERADDVPARLSKNEFVMTADAVRAAGGGNINKGAKRMYNLMNNLEARV
jgi:hypothetical protein